MISYRPVIIMGVVNRQEGDYNLPINLLNDWIMFVNLSLEVCIFSRFSPILATVLP